MTPYKNKNPKSKAEVRSLQKEKSRSNFEVRSSKFEITPYKNKNPKSKAEDEVESTKKFQRPDLQKRKSKAEVENKENLQKKKNSKAEVQSWDKAEPTKEKRRTLA